MAVAPVAVDTAGVAAEAEAVMTEVRMALVVGTDMTATLRPTGVPQGPHRRHGRPATVVTGRKTRVTIVSARRAPVSAPRLVASTRATTTFMEAAASAAAGAALGRCTCPSARRKRPDHFQATKRAWPARAEAAAAAQAQAPMQR